jgi:Dolichyl-phosphate-mannose-protein mannosyltransferase
MCSPTSRSRRSSRARTNFFSRPKVLRTFGRIAALGAFCGFLLYRLAPDVRGKPYYEDEALSGLIAMRPLGEVLDTVVLDRGGAPLHFVLAHAAFWVDPSADALRWLSVAAALAAVPLCFDLGRRLGGAEAGFVAAAVVASSTALAVYGSFGRMYALFVFVAALFSDLFVRALQLRTTSAVAAAAAAGWLLPAVHPYGAIPAGVALLAVAALWSRRPLSAAWPVAVATIAATPFLFADLRLADRAAIGDGQRSLASPGEAWRELDTALSSFAGGAGLPLLFFSALALVGLVELVRREPAFAALTLSILVPPILFVLIRTEATPDLSPRHLFYGLPLWAAAIGVGMTKFLRPKLAVAVVVLVAIASPASSLRDPREIGFATAAPGDAPSVRAEANDLLLPYSAVFLASLPDVRSGLALPHAPGEEILDALEHAEEPIGAVHIAVPTPGWTLLTVNGPFSKAEALAAAARRLRAFEQRPALEEWLDWIEPGLCEALRDLGEPCP